MTQLSNRTDDMSFQYLNSVGKQGRRLSKAINTVSKDQLSETFSEMSMSTNIGTVYQMSKLGNILSSQAGQILPRIDSLRSKSDLRIDKNIYQDSNQKSRNDN